MILHSLMASYTLTSVKALTAEDNIDIKDSTMRTKNDAVSQAFVASKATESTPGSSLMNFLAYNTLLVLLASSNLSGIRREQYQTDTAITSLTNIAVESSISQLGQIHAFLTDEFDQDIQKDLESQEDLALPGVGQTIEEQLLGGDSWTNEDIEDKEIKKESEELNNKEEAKLVIRNLIQNSGNL